jgi:hypothetical protein
MLIARVNAAQVLKRVDEFCMGTASASYSFAWRGSNQGPLLWHRKAWTFPWIRSNGSGSAYDRAKFGRSGTYRRAITGRKYCLIRQIPLWLAVFKWNETRLLRRNDRNSKVLRSAYITNVSHVCWLKDSIRWLTYVLALCCSEAASKWKNLPIFK